MSVCFVDDPDGGPVLALLYSENRAYRMMWESLDGVESYAYWNHSDPPIEVDEQDWQERELTWGRAVGHLAPAEVGVSWELHDDNAVFLCCTDDTIAVDVAASVLAVLNDVGRSRYGSTVEQIIDTITTCQERTEGAT